MLEIIITGRLQVNISQDVRIIAAQQSKWFL